MLMQDNTTGVGTYTRALLRAHGSIAQEASVLVDRLPADPPPSARAGRWLRAIWPLPRTAVASQRDGNGLLVAHDIFRLAQVYFDIHRQLLPLKVPGPAGIMHWTYPLPLRIAGWTNLYTVHDLIPVIHPDLSPIDSGRHRRILDRISASGATIVTVSDVVAGEIAQVLNLPSSRIHNCGCAIEPRASEMPLPDDLLPQGYFLVIGSKERRKNLDRLILAYRESNVAMPLVLAGPEGWDATMLDAPGLKRLPYLADPALRTLLCNARAVLMPSLAEGFGLPVIEAMALGVPVMTSRGGALEEIAGGTALLVDPLDITDMATAMRRLCEDDRLCAALATSGRRNSLRFTPERFASRLSALYSQLSPRSSP